MIIITIITSAIMCLDELEFKIALDLKTIIFEKQLLEKRKGSLVHMLIKDYFYFKIDLGDKGFETMKVCTNYLENFRLKRQNIEGDIFTNLEMNVNELRSFIISQLTGDEKNIVFVLRDIRKVKNIHLDVFEKAIKDVFSKKDNIIRNKSKKLIRLLSQTNCRSDENIFYPFSEILQNNIYFRYKLFQDSDELFFFSLEMPIDCDEIKFIIEKIIKMSIFRNIKNYIELSSSYEEKPLHPSKQFNDIPFETFPPDFRFQNNSRPEMEIEIIKIGGPFIPGYEQIYVNADFNIFHFTDIYMSSTQRLCRGICILLCHVLRNKDLFRSIMKKADCERDYERYLFDVRNLTDKIFDILKDRKFKKDPTAFKPFLIIFYISCCDYFKYDFLDTVRKMAEDYYAKKIVKTDVSYKEAVFVLEKVLMFISIPPVQNNPHNDHLDAMENYKVTYCIHQDRHSQLIDYHNLINISEIEDKIPRADDPDLRLKDLDTW